MDGQFDISDPLATATEREGDRVLLDAGDGDTPIRELSTLHQCVVYLRVARELETEEIARTLHILPAEVMRLENEARQHLQAATPGFNKAINSGAQDSEHQPTPLRS